LARAFSCVRRMLRVLEVGAYLFAYDVLSLFGMKWVWRLVHRQPRQAATPADEIVIRLARAIDTASALYVKPVKCLQRAIVAAWYLRLRGYSCVLVVGAHVARKEGHAWVEAGGQVLGDPRRLRRFFRPLARV
jgi:transglutaminase superfamily protein